MFLPPAPYSTPSSTNASAFSGCVKATIGISCPASFRTSGLSEKRPGMTCMPADSATASTTPRLVAMTMDVSTSLRAYLHRYKKRYAKRWLLIRVQLRCRLSSPCRPCSTKCDICIIHAHDECHMICSTAHLPKSFAV